MLGTLIQGRISIAGASISATEVALTDAFTTFERDNTVLLQLAAKNLLTGYKDAFGELDPLGRRP